MILGKIGRREGMVMLELGIGGCYMKGDVLYVRPCARQPLQIDCRLDKAEIGTVDFIG